MTFSDLAELQRRGRLRLKPMVEVLLVGDDMRGLEFFFEASLRAGLAARKWCGYGFALTAGWLFLQAKSK